METERERERQREGVGTQRRGTRGGPSLRPGNSAQPSPTGTSDESIDLGVGLQDTSLPPSPLAAAPSPHHRALFLFRSSRFASSLSLPRRHGHCALSLSLSPFLPPSLSLFAAFFFSLSPKVDQTDAAARPLCPTTVLVLSREALRRRRRRCSRETQLSSDPKKTGKTVGMFSRIFTARASVGDDDLQKRATELCRKLDHKTPVID